MKKTNSFLNYTNLCTNLSLIRKKVSELKYLSNQKGYGLLIVLLTIVVVGLLSIPLINNALSSAAQVQTSNQQMKANELRDYGQKYFRQLFSVTVEEILAAQDEAEGSVNRSEALQPEVLAALLDDSLGAARELDNLQIEGEDSALITLTVESIEAVGEENPAIEILYTSTGEFNDRSQEADELLRLEFTGATGGDDGPPGGVYQLAEKIPDPAGEGMQEGQRSYDVSTVIESDTYFARQMTLNSGGNNNAVLQINGDTLAYEGIDIKQGDQLLIDGYFYHKGRANGSGDDLQTNPANNSIDSFIQIGRDILVENFSIRNQALVCAKGSVYQLRNNDIMKVDNHFAINKLDTANGESCEDPSTWEKGIINYEDQNFTAQEGGTNPSAPGWRITSASTE